MAHIATLKILVDAVTENEVYDALNELFRNTQVTDEDEPQGIIIDWAFDNVTPVSAALEDAITNETYSEGDAFIDSPRAQPSQAMEMLALATTALRDLSAGYPAKEISGRSGMGLTTLLKDLVMFCRDNGIDDEGGWGLDARDNPDSATVPGTGTAIQPFPLVVEAYATSEFGEGPDYAEIMVDQHFLDRLQRLRQICHEKNLESVSVGTWPERWDKQEKLEIRGGSLFVLQGRSFWYEAHPQHADYHVETRPIEIDALVRIAQEGPRAELSDPFLCYRWSNGRLYYASDKWQRDKLIEQCEQQEEDEAELTANPD